jgi:hypothetical protein
MFTISIKVIDYRIKCRDHLQRMVATRTPKRLMNYKQIGRRSIELCTPWKENP